MLKEKGQKDNQRSTKHTYKSKDRVTQTPLNTGDKLKIYIYNTVNHQNSSKI
jgi:hypothetical protein